MNELNCKDLDQCVLAPIFCETRGVIDSCLDERNIRLNQLAFASGGTLLDKLVKSGNLYFFDFWRKIISAAMKAAFNPKKGYYMLDG